MVQGGGGGWPQYVAMATRQGDLGVVTNFETAFTYFQEAAVGGDDDAQRRLGRAYRDGTLGLETDLEKATMWLQMAGDSEDEEEEEEEEPTDGLLHFSLYKRNV